MKTWKYLHKQEPLSSPSFDNGRQVWCRWWSCQNPSKMSVWFLLYFVPQAHLKPNKHDHIGPSFDRAVSLHLEKHMIRVPLMIRSKVKTNPWFYKCHKFPEHRLLDHPPLVQPLSHTVDKWKTNVLRSNLCHLFKIYALLHILPQLLHHPDVDVSLQEGGTNLLQLRTL